MCLFREMWEISNRLLSEIKRERRYINWLMRGIKPLSVGCDSRMLTSTVSTLQVLNFQYKTKIFLQKNRQKILVPPERPEIKHQDGAYEPTLSLATLITRDRQQNTRLHTLLHNMMIGKHKGSRVNHLKLYKRK